MNATTSTSRYRYHRLGAMTYGVYTRTLDEYVGVMYRGRSQDEWHIEPVQGKRATVYTSRETAAGVMESAVREAHVPLHEKQAALEAAAQADVDAAERLQRAYRDLEAAQIAVEQAQRASDEAYAALREAEGRL